MRSRFVYSIIGSSVTGCALSCLVASCILTAYDTPLIALLCFAIGTTACLVGGICYGYGYGRVLSGVLSDS